MKALSSLRAQLLALVLAGSASITVAQFGPAPVARPIAGSMFAIALLVLLVPMVTWLVVGRRR